MQLDAPRDLMYIELVTLRDQHSKYVWMIVVVGVAIALGLFATRQRRRATLLRNIAPHAFANQPFVVAKPFDAGWLFRGVTDEEYREWRMTEAATRGPVPRAETERVFRWDPARPDGLFLVESQLWADARQEPQWVSHRFVPTQDPGLKAGLDPSTETLVLRGQPVRTEGRWVQSLAARRSDRGSVAVCVSASRRDKNRGGPPLGGGFRYSGPYYVEVFDIESGCRVGPAYELEGEPGAILRDFTCTWLSPRVVFVLEPNGIGFSGMYLIDLEAVQTSTAE